jgi:maltooligosyltrehalose trehalohydrolase
MPYPFPFSFSYPVGASLQDGGVAFRVWADAHKEVSVRIKDLDHPLPAETNGYFSGHVPGVRDGDTYEYFVDGKGPFPDPASRFQPQGPHGPSQVTNPEAFSWADQSWPGITLSGQIIYELHVGTFTSSGTWRDAVQQLPELAALGITVLEIMPVAEFEGAFGWGYDGVDLFAPTRNYGSPDDFRAFVDAAHAHGLGVILDVVYNHVGPDGNYLSMFSERYFTPKYKTDWGAAINFDGEKSEPVREFYAANAAYWIKEFHLDGLRLDATQNIYDSSKDHILTEIVSRARKAAGRRGIIVVGENEPQNSRLIRPQGAGGYGMDALWNDDFHHSAAVAATGSREAYYGDYLGSPRELLSAVKYGFLYQGQWYSWQKQRRGTSTLGLSRSSMIDFLQNHDQVANSARGLRLHKLTTPGRYRALTALCLLIPATPMLFQGQEFASSAPFLFFADHKPALADQVRAGRAEFLDQWRSLSLRQLKYDDPCSRETFDKCKLDFSEREKHSETYALHRDLLKLRKAEPVFSQQDHQLLDGEILGPEAFVVRFFSEGYQDDRLLIVNLGTELRLSPSPMPLLAPREDSEWAVQWSSEDPRYGGNGTPPLDSDLNWIVPAHAAVVLKPIARKSEQAKK